MQIKVVTGLEEEHARLLRQLRPGVQAHHASRHRQAAAVPGAAWLTRRMQLQAPGALTGPAPDAGSGRWSLPQLILDEQGYCERAGQRGS